MQGNLQDIRKLQSLYPRETKPRGRSGREDVGKRERQKERGGGEGEVVEIQRKRKRKGWSKREE